MCKRRALDPVYSHSFVPLVRLKLRAPPRERDHPLRNWGGLPNGALPRDLTTSSQRTSSYSHFQVFTPFSRALFALLTNTNSGDDHDYCEYTHTSHERRILEVTVKSLSIAMGIRQPGLQLLSLSSKELTNAHRPCLLPDQVHLYCWVYAPLILTTIVLVAARALITGPSWYQKHTPNRSESLELPYPTSQQVRSVPSRKGSYRTRVAQEMWAVTWPPLAVYMVTALMTFW